MSEIHRFLFEGQPVRGQLVRLTGAWREILRRRASNTQTGAYPQAVTQLLGEMAAASVLMQASIRFEGALIMQIFGDGPLKLAVAEVQRDLRLRATASVAGEVAPQADLAQLLNVTGKGRCAITLDPQGRQPGQQAYQGVAALVDAQGRSLPTLARVIEHYMRQSEQLDATLVLAAGEQAACGLLIQRLPVQGQGNLAQSNVAHDDDADDDGYARIAMLARTLRRDELLALDADALLRRLFWQEKLTRLTPAAADAAQQQPRFACPCSRARMAAMLRTLGRAESESALREQGRIEVGCDFCGRQEYFDAVDVERLFTPTQDAPPVARGVQ
ncbi:MAG: Hsp33 family molecular chaperone HslO [Burkholderiaceae bacterium]|jgi:molecular chaperone Hsp33|nr:Hsp33 family molecular chaperone HslO [Burkholderiaceae bacterium]